MRKLQIAELLSAMDAQRNTAATNEAIQSGLALSNVWSIFDSFVIPSALDANANYMIEPRNESVITTLPEPLSCDSDFPLVTGDNSFDKVYYTPREERLGIKLCKDKCDSENLQMEYAKAAKKAGASYGKLYETFVWLGDGTRIRPVTQTQGFEVSNVTGSDFENLDTKSASTIANFFYQAMWGMDDPRFILGSITAELIGWRQQGTGDNCNEVWNCVMSLIATRLGESVADASARFIYRPDMDSVTGIDPQAPADVHASLFVVDKMYARMGRSADLEIYNAVAQGHDFGVQEVRNGHTTGVQILRDGGVRSFFGFVDHAKVIAATGGRYGSTAAPAITVPTPLI